MARIDRAPRPLPRVVSDARYDDREAVYITSIDDIGSAAPGTGQAIGTGPQSVRAVPAKLPDNYRRILELRFLQGLSIKESAAELGISVGNAKVRQHRALRLAAQMNEKDER
jgi:DNA-directed RNA polymerase specialized sigma24 family protein